MIYEHQEIVQQYENLRDVGLTPLEKKIATKYFTDKKGILLDLGCGTGRTTFPLYQEGYVNIIGVDYSNAMIEKCKQNAHDLGISIPFVVMDITKPIKIGTKVDYIFAPYNMLMTIDNQFTRHKTFINLHGMLDKDGVFVFSFADRDKYKTINRKYYRDILENDGHTYFGDPEEYAYIPKKDEMMDLVRNTGMEVVKEIHANIMEPINKNAIYYVCRRAV